MPLVITALGCDRKQRMKGRTYVLTMPFKDKVPLRNSLRQNYLVMKIIAEGQTLRLVAELEASFMTVQCCSRQATCGTSQSLTHTEIYEET